jgi:hypothetical protein
MTVFSSPVTDSLHAVDQFDSRVHIKIHDCVESNLNGGLAVDT